MGLRTKIVLYPKMKAINIFSLSTYSGIIQKLEEIVCTLMQISTAIFIWPQYLFNFLFYLFFFILNFKIFMFSQQYICNVMQVYTSTEIVNHTSWYCCCVVKFIIQ